MKTQGNLVEKVEENTSVLENMFSDDLEDYMFYLDFYHDSFCISESAMNKFDLPDTNFQSVEEMFKFLVYEKDLPYVIQTIAQARNSSMRKTVKCRCCGINNEIFWANCRFELIKGNWEQWDVIVGSIQELKQEQFKSVTTLKTDTHFISDYCSMVTSEVHSTGYVMKLGIDNIKEINEKHGMHMAENIMQCTFDFILQYVDSKVRIYKTGADKFILFDKSGRTAKDAEVLYRSIKEEVNRYNEQVEFPVFYTISAGVAEFDSFEDNYIEQCKKVDFAFNTAVRRGKNGIFLFEEHEYEKYITRLDIEEKLRHDVRCGFRGFEVFYQPIVDTETEQITGAEALLRWNCEQYGNISPGVFIPILEESGLIVPVGRWVMKSAVKQCKEWQEKIPGFRMNINVSYIQLKKSDVAFDALHNLQEYELDSKYVLFELTESGFVETDSTIRHIIKSFQKQKIKLGLDDFGTGYSNLCYLNDLKVYIVKIDRTFVMKALKSNYHYKLLKHIVDMAHSIHLKVCIEGIEEERELEIIKELEPDYIQGYYFGKPVSSKEFYERNMNKIPS